MLAYRLPREPSTPRIAVWRRLKRLGVAQLLDGLVALPLDARNKEQLEWVAEQIADAGGDATVWIGRPSTRADEAALARSLQGAISAEYRDLVDEIANEQTAGTISPRTVMRLRRTFRRIRQRDHFPPAEAEEARRAIEDLWRLTEATR
jgi:hypothetical protein